MRRAPTRGRTRQKQTRVATIRIQRRTMSTNAKAPSCQAKKSQLHKALNTSCARKNESAMRLVRNPPRHQTSHAAIAMSAYSGSRLAQKPKVAVPMQAGIAGCRKTWPGLTPPPRRQKRQSSQRANRSAPGFAVSLTVTPFNAFPVYLFFLGPGHIR